MDALLAKFLIFLEEEQLAATGTIMAYRNDVAQLAQFLTQRGRTWEQVTSRDIQNYCQTLQARNYANATVGRKVSAMKSFFSFLQATGLLTSNPTETLSSPAPPKRSTPKTISVEAVTRLLQEPTRRITLGAARDKAMLDLLYATGMRPTELLNLNIEDIVADKERISARLPNRTIPIGDAATTSLAQYITGERRLLTKRRQQQRAVFLNRSGQRLTRQGFWRIIKEYAKSAQLPLDVTANTLRNSCAIHRLADGASLQEVQTLLGHAVIGTTQWRYAKR